MDDSRLFAGLPLLVLVAVAAVEAAWLMRRGVRYDWKGYWASFGDAAGRALLGVLIQGGVVAVLLFAIWEFRLTTIAMDRPWHWLALFVGQEFCYYWMHRADHRVRWFWLNHSVHHSATQYNLSTAYRLGWTGKLTGAAVFFGPLVWLGFPVPYVVGALALNLLYQYWLHTELVPRLPRPVEFVFNTPSHHRVHHGSNMSYIDKNYGGVFIVWDRLFGTYAAEVEPVRYGLIHDVGSQNPVKFNYLETVAMLRDVAHAKTWRARFGYVFGPPGWSEKAVPAPSLTT